MSFTKQIKNEITTQLLNEIENRNLLLGYIYAGGTIENNKVTLTLENELVANKLYKTLKYCYKIDSIITVKTRKSTENNQVCILESIDTNNAIKDELNNLDLTDKESKISFIKGVFLCSGSIRDPLKSGYHLEIQLDKKNKAETVQKLLASLNYNFKILKREKKYMLYLKAGEEISDFIKLLNTVNSLFYFEDIRIYRDHTNMVNRLNNCEQANFEKSLKTADKQIEMIKFLKDNDYLMLLDQKTKDVAEYRLKYNDVSYQTLSEIISDELNIRVSKSYINHHLRKISDIYNKIINSQNT